MYSDWVWQLLGAVVFIWLIALSFFLRKEWNFLTQLFPKSGDRDIRNKFEEILEELAKVEADVSQVKKRIVDLEEAELKHIQRVQLLRYNPYQDTGGDQSFSIALLDNVGNGIVITSLHTRAGTRVFSKPVISGKPSKYDFSQEELEVVAQALK